MKSAEKVRFRSDRLILLMSVAAWVFMMASPALGQTTEILRPREFPFMGNRVAVWVVAQLHILFAAFILGAPIFVVISEWLGMKHKDSRYDRLAKEVTKVTAPFEPEGGAYAHHAHGAPLPSPFGPAHGHHPHHGHDHDH